MKDKYFVIFNKSGIDRLVKTDRFELKGGEYAQQVNFDVDDRLFAKVTIPKTTIIVGADSVIRQVSIDQENPEVTS